MPEHRIIDPRLARLIGVFEELFGLLERPGGDS
jgi:hypothetical protein